MSQFERVRCMVIHSDLAEGRDTRGDLIRSDGKRVKLELTDTVLMSLSEYLDTLKAGNALAAAVEAALAWPRNQLDTWDTVEETLKDAVRAWRAEMDR